MIKLQKIFSTPKPVIGMVHLQALPGSPKYGGSVQHIIDLALAEAEIFVKAGIDGIMIENMHDVPYLKGKVGPEISSLMAIIGYEIKKKTKIPCGIQILAAANKAALAVALNASLDFIRVEGFVFGHIADEGYIDSCAGELLRYRTQIGANKIAVWTDIKKKHSSHTITADVSLVETVQAAAYFLSDGVIITGKNTAEAVDLISLKTVKLNTQLPVIIGSGITIGNIKEYLHFGDAFIIGSHFKADGHWANPLSFERISKFMLNIQKIRKE